MARSWLLACVLILSVWGGVAARAQPGRLFQRSRSYFKSQVDVATSRQARQNIAQAKRDLAAGEIERCVRLIQEILLGDCTGSVSEKAESFQGVRKFCIEFLEGLPAEGLAAYRELYDPIATQLHTEAIAAAQPDLLLNVYLRYPITSAGPHALRDAVSLLLEQGALHASIDCGLLYLDAVHADAESLSTVEACLALAYARIGDSNGIEQLSDLVRAADDSPTLHIAGREQPLAEWIEQLKAQLDAKNVARNAHTTNLTRSVLEADGWRTDIPNRDDSKRHIYSQYDDFGRFTTSSAFPWNPMRPVISDGAIFISTGVETHAFDLFSGSLRWTAGGLTRVAQASRNHRIEMPLAVDRGLVFAALETPVRARRTLMNYTPQVAIAHRRLSAFDAANGKTVWSHNTNPPGDASTKKFILSLNITSNPIIHGESLFVNATRFHTSYHSYLCCFDRKTGRLKWNTFVSTGQMEQNMFGNPVREAVSGQITLHQGVLYFCTNMGLIAAVDARLGTLRFVTPYEQIRIPRATRYAGIVQERAPTWASCPPIVSDGRVFVAPQDSQDLLAIDIQTGVAQRVLTRTQADRFRYVLGPFDHRICVAGRRVAFYNTETLARDAQTTVGRDEIREGVQGWPVIDGNRLFAPTMFFGQPKMLIWDLDRLKLIADPTLTGEPRVPLLGNLVVADGTIVSAAGGSRRTYLTTRYDADGIRRMVAAESQQNPSSPTPFLRLGALSLQSKNFGEALASFTEALRLAQAPESGNHEDVRHAHQALFNLYMRLSKLQPSELEFHQLDTFACLEKALPHATDNTDRIDIYFSLMKRSVVLRDQERVAKYSKAVDSRFGDLPYDHIGGFEVLRAALPRGRYAKVGLLAGTINALSAEYCGRPQEAVDALQALILKHGNERLGPYTVWHLARTRIAGLLETNGRSIYAAYDRSANALFKEADGRSLTPLRRLVDQFPNSLHIENAYADMTRILIDANHPEQATSTMLEGLSRQGETRIKGLHALADALDAGGCRNSADAVWRLAANVDPRAIIPSGERVQTVAEVLEARIERTPNHVAETPPDQQPVTELPAWTLKTKKASSTWRLLTARGNAPTSANDMLFARDAERLVAISLDANREMWSFAIHPADELDLLWVEGRLFLDQDDHIVALNPVDGHVLWRTRRLDGYVVDFCGAPGQIITLLESPAAGTSLLLSLNIQDGTTVQSMQLNTTAAESLRSHGPWILVRVENPAVTMVLNSLTLQEAPGLSDGLPYDLNAFLPFFNRDGHVISVNPGRFNNEKRILATDPWTGVEKFSRPFGNGAVVFRGVENRDTLTYELVKRTSARVARTTSSVVCVDLKTGSIRTQHTLPSRVRVRRGGALHTTAEDLYIVARRTQATAQGIRLEYWVRDVDLNNNEVRWETLRFTNIADLTIHPLGSTVLLSVTEARRKRNLTINRSTVYLADGRTGSIRSQITLDVPTNSITYGLNVVARNGCLIIVDGPSLKVYKP